MKISLNTYKISAPWEAKVLLNRRLTQDSSPNDTRHVVLDIEGSALEYVPGQSVGVIPPGVDAKGKPHAVRLYSIASQTGGEEGFSKALALCVKRALFEDPATGAVKQGVASNYICDLKAGDSVRLTGPAGNRFILPETLEERHFVFIATGTGIAPFRGMIKDLVRRNFSGQIWIFFGVPYRTDLLYEAEFKDYTPRPQFHFVAAVSREEKNPDGTKVYVQHRLLEHKNVLAPLVSSPNTLVYVCGLKGMEKGLDEAFRTMVSPKVFLEVKKRILTEVY